MSDTRYPIPTEDKSLRASEWQPLELGYGQAPTMREYEWDPITNGTRIVKAPVIEGNRTQRDKHVRPAE